jgi:hypothetical protein
MYSIAVPFVLTANVLFFALNIKDDLIHAIERDNNTNDQGVVVPGGEWKYNVLWLANLGPLVVLLIDFMLN